MADENTATSPTVEELQAQVEKLTADLAQLTSDKEASELSLRICQEALAKSEESLTSISADRENLHAELKALTEAKETAEANVVALQAKLDADESRTLLDQAEAKIAELEKSNSELAVQAKAWGIISEEQARDFVKKNYNPGPKVKIIMVTQDGQVFYDSDIQGSGQAHVLEKTVKSFTFKND